MTRSRSLRWSVPLILVALGGSPALAQLPTSYTVMPLDPTTVATVVARDDDGTAVVFGQDALGKWTKLYPEVVPY